MPLRARILAYVSVRALAFSWLISSCLYANTTKIVWTKQNLPPSYIFQGENAGKGALDLVIKYFGKELLQYDMHVINMNRKRFWHELKRGQNYCEVAMIKTVNRQKFAYFSIPVLLIPPAKIVFNRVHWITLGKPNSLRLSSLLENRNLTGGIPSERSYGHIIDTLLHQYENKPEANIRRKVIRLPALYSMVAMNRLDYTIDYEPLVSFLSPETGRSNLVIVDIEEELKYHPLYVACTKNDWGERVIGDINKVLKLHRMTDSFRQCFTIYGENFNGPFFQRYRKELSGLR